MKSSFFLVTLVTIISIAFSCNDQGTVSTGLNQNGQLALQDESGDPAVLAMMHAINDQLAAQGLGYAVESIEFFTIGLGRPSNRIHQQPFRWVPNDPRRAAQGIDITYLVDQTYQGTTSGVSSTDTEAAIDRSMDTWDDNPALSKVDIVKRADPGTDPTIFDEFFPGSGDERGNGGPRLGYPFFADIVNAGWYPRNYFEDVGGPGGGRGILAFSVSFIFGSTDADGNFIPSDINGDNYLDTALNEVYYNDTFGDPNDNRAGNPWAIDEPLPSIDVETVALHENGHSLGIGHFGPPPDAVLNPVYAGIRQDPLSPDEAGMEAVWGSWPNP